MERLNAADMSCKCYTWQPGDGTRYTILLTGSSPAGDRFVHLVDWRSTLKNQPARIIRIGRYALPSENTLAKQGKLVPYDARALREFLAEIGYPHDEQGRE